jgi:hypothetical protein
MFFVLAFLGSLLIQPGNFPLKVSDSVNEE